MPLQATSLITTRRTPTLVAVGVGVRVAVGVLVGVCVAVGVGVRVGVAVTVGVWVGVRVLVAVCVGVRVGVWEAVGVMVGVRNGEGALVFQIPNWPGDSGAGVFNSDGHLVAVLKGTPGYFRRDGSVALFDGLMLAEPLAFTREQWLKAFTSEQSTTPCTRCGMKPPK